MSCQKRGCLPMRNPGIWIIVAIASLSVGIALKHGIAAGFIFFGIVTFIAVVIGVVILGADNGR